MEDIILTKYRIARDGGGSHAVIRRASESVTYRASEVTSGREVELSIWPADSLPPAVREQLEAEALAAKELSHVNIPALYDFGFEDDQLIYVTERLDGTSTGDWVRENGPMSIDAVLRIGLQVVGALGAAAFHQIFHHAINPANLIIIPGQTADGGWPMIKLQHLIGIAPTFSDAAMAGGSAAADASYASPEQLANGAVDFRSEIYSLGCTLSFLLTGAVPIGAPGQPIEAARWAGIPRHFDDLLRRMIAQDREARPLDPLALHQELQDCLTEVEKRGAVGRKLGLPVMTRPVTILKPISRRPVPWRPLAIAATVLLLGTLGALVLQRQLHVRHATAQAEPIGVPIGVPETSVADSASSAAEVKSQPDVTSASTPSIVQRESAATTGEVASATPPSEPPIVAAASIAPASPAPREETPLVTNTQETQPAPPAEGPREGEMNATAPVQTESAVASQPPQVEREQSESATTEAAPREVSTTTSKVAVERPHKETRPVAKTSESPSKPRNKVRVAKALPPDDEAPPPLRRGQSRARFVGSTPDGRWLMQLPSSEIVVVEPR